MGRCVYSAQSTPNALKLFSRKLMLGETSDGEFILLRIRELDNDDGKPDSTDEDTHVSKLQHWPMGCSAVRAV